MFQKRIIEGVGVPEKVRKVYEQERAGKFLATSSAEGITNVALIVSQLPGEEREFIFGEFMMVKTLANLKENLSVASVAITEKLEIAGYRGKLREWVKSGPYVDRINTIDFFRYNAYAGIHNVGIVDVIEITQFPERISYAALARDYALAVSAAKFLKAAAPEGIEFPREVRKKFNSLTSVKVIAMTDDEGNPLVFPALSTFFNGPCSLIFKISEYNKEIESMKLPVPVAMNVLTLDLFTYQAKGELREIRSFAGSRFGLVLLTKLYSSVPPFCGERLL